MALCRKQIVTQIRYINCAASFQTLQPFTTSCQHCDRPKAEKLKIKSGPPKNIRNDHIGPPDTVSNLRPLLFYAPKSETELQKQYRLERQAVQEWNQEYWAAHNTKFVEKKDAFIKEKLEELQKADPEAAITKLSAEQLSEFYRAFLDDHRKMHAEYNKQWYKKNFGLLLPALRVRMEKLFRKQSGKKA